MFQFGRFPAYYYLFHNTLTEYCSAGFPHSDIHGSLPAFGSPWLFADCCVLLRLLVPRHSPCALCSLTILFWFRFPRRKFVVLTCLRFFALLFYAFTISHYFFFVQFSRYVPSRLPVPACSSLFGALPAFPSNFRLGGLKWIRTTDLTLIRRAL